VLDASSPRVDEERRVATDVLEDLGVEPERIVPAWNKTDLPGARAPRGEIGISALAGQGMEALERAIRARARPEPDRFTLEIPYSNARAIAARDAAFRVIEEEDKGDSLRLRIAGERRNLGSLSRFVEAEEAGSEALLRRRAR
jgi:50S ribosomal subunit-associated GTPase HflX